MKRPLTFALLTLTLCCWAGPARAQTQMEMNTTAHNEAMAIDADLNKSYKQLSSRLDARTRALLIKAELKWIAFRDAECNSVEDKYRGGSIQPTVFWNSYGGLSQARNKQLATTTPGRPDPAADAVLNKIYQELNKSRDATGQKLLQQAELAWIAFRDAESDFEAARYKSSRAGALARLTKTRYQELIEELKDG
jgi:uncharacterized protein YecT (DUF1311 family)